MFVRRAHKVSGRETNLVGCVLGWASDFKKIETGHISAFSPVKYDQLNGIYALSLFHSLTFSLCHSLHPFLS